MIAVELTATGALAMFWFQGLSAGNSCWPRSAGTMRSSSSSTWSRRLRLRRGRRDRGNMTGLRSGYSAQRMRDVS